MSGATRITDVQGRRLMLAHLDEVLWPEDGITKQELLDYYTTVADHLLPFVASRPLSLQRAPDPLTGECVYQKTAPPGLPGWIPTRRVRSEHLAGSYADHVVGGDLPSLLYLLNLGYISVHPWACTVEALDRPDQLLFDLDPVEIAFREVRNAALLVRDLLGLFRVRSWVKTSGGRGLHVMVPLDAHCTFEQARTAAETIVRMARSREPRLFTLDMRRARRRGKILIDVHRNRRGATLVAPYAVREYSTATVSTPLEWSELGRALYPEEFHIRNMGERLQRQDDPLTSFFEQPQSIAPLLEGGRARRLRPLA
ncbi:MAG TPA: non-homologous end-joining DNA ligase [Methylomirabilota bacterium]|jgi:bifunctional non-homologous end joining protein LigD|nr:non-homologous end-joining DNA ligase [Methylomirabilota bacterium]